MNLQDEFDPDVLWPIELPVTCSRTVFEKAPVEFASWGTLNYLVGPNGSGKTTLFMAIMEAARRKWPNKVKILGTGRLSPLEKSVAPWIGDPTSRLFQEDDLKVVYKGSFGQETSHQAFQILEKRLDLQIRVLGFLRHIFKRTIHLKPTRKGLQVLGVAEGSSEYHIIDECHGLKELITLLTFLYDDTFSVLGIDEPELHLHPQFQRFLLDELRAVAGNPDEKGKKLIFVVTHSPVFLDLRHLADLSNVVVFSGGGSPPRRAELSGLGQEELLKIRQALPSFHAAQRELLFSTSPIVVEGSSDAAVLLNLATKIDIPLGAAGIGVAPMGGKNRLFAFRALLASLAKSRARFILDLDAAVDCNLLHALDDDPAVVEHLARAGSGGRKLSKEAGELIGLIRDYVARAYEADCRLGSLTVDDTHDLTGSKLAMVLSVLQQSADRGEPFPFDAPAAKAILGKCDLVRAATRAGNVLILKRGPIEAYYESPVPYGTKDFDRQQALQAELDIIWTADDVSILSERYSEMLEFVREAGVAKASIVDVVREPVANLIHLLQTEISSGRVQTIEQAKESSRAKAEGYWYVCELEKLAIRDKTEFSGSLVVKPELGGARYEFDHNTRAYEVAASPPPGDERSAI